MGTSAFGAGLLLPRWGTAQERPVLTPWQSPGPFYPRFQPRDADDNLLRLPAIAGGRPLVVAGRMLGRDGRALAGALVELWQTDPAGRYVAQVGAQGVTPGFKGYGRQQTDTKGNFVFRTVFPGRYPGRTPHLHFAVTFGRFGGTSPDASAPFTTQMYFAGDPANGRDGLLGRIRDRRQRDNVVVKTEEGLARFQIVLDV